MPEHNTQTRADWRSWLTLAWAIVFGLLYARMVVEARAPRLLRSIGIAAVSADRVNR